ncbi:hypothetical protein [Streptomyces sp. CB02400]|uniref:hypothetical protein n=1 Tax=Streptomyces sp. CB02400 TaxID=1703944 RepID=UPI003FA76242
MISGSPLQDVVHESNDVSFVGVHHPGLGLGFDVWVGGGLSTNFMLAQWLGVFVTLEEMPEIWAGVVSVFRDYGYRRLRNRARLKFLVADWGVVRFCEALERGYLQRTLTDGPAPAPPTGPRDHVGAHPQRDGRFYVGATPAAGHAADGNHPQPMLGMLRLRGRVRISVLTQQQIFRCWFGVCSGRSMAGKQKVVDLIG